jgi:pyruvate,water dikinase
MPLTLNHDQVRDQDISLVGGKGLSLALLARGGFRVPRSLCVTTEAYRNFIGGNGLAERIQLELNRKSQEEMRWEEIWDTSLRIRNLFLTLPMAADLEDALRSAITENFQQAPVAIRSSAPEEDADSSSFAGLHESFINITGTNDILDHIRLVWASLWSDRALLYRREIGLNTGKSAMAVLIQEVIDGRCSGILFSRSPTNENKCVIEAVHGLNQALVDGSIEPDRWFVARDDGKIEAVPATRSQYMIAAATGTALRPLPERLQHQPPLSEKEVRQLFKTGQAVEKFYHAPQDIEWTYADQALTVLQARPISTLVNGDPDDKRPWYLSLHRSLENLQDLQLKIEKDQLPAMEREAKSLKRINLDEFSNGQLADEIEKRVAVKEKWAAVYWRDFIPFAHGMRLFGQIYNDKVRPANPYEFVDLLVHTSLQSVDRNKILQDLATKVRLNEELRRQLEKGIAFELVDREFARLLADFTERYGDLSCSLGLEDQCRSELKTLIAVILETADNPPSAMQPQKQDQNMLVEGYLQSFPDDKRLKAQEILELGRASYRLRDDDNIYLGRIEQEVARALEVGHRRLEESGKIEVGSQLAAGECLNGLRDQAYRPKTAEVSGTAGTARGDRAKARQLLGQPAGPGIAHGKARVVKSRSDLAMIKKGDVLVCDAIEPNMTFVVPLVAAIIERRGGMLIHGAIIAREYGIPCITGIADATELINSGDTLNVDGYLGIATITSRKRPDS